MALASGVHRFVERQIMGAETYGDASFTHLAAEIVDEIQQELEVPCARSLLHWIRLEWVRRSADRITENGGGYG